MSLDYNLPPPIGHKIPVEPDYAAVGPSYFWPILLLIIGTLFSTAYQIVAMQEQLGSLKQAIVQLDPKIKQAQYEKGKLYKLASDVLQLAATDPNAKQIATAYKIEQKPAAATTDASPSK